MVLNIAWMLTIVFLPIAAALSGTMATDALQELVYIGDMLATSIVMTGITVLVHVDRRLWAEDRDPPGVAGIAASSASALLFVVALALALLVPGLGYLALFILFLTGPVQAVLERLLTR